MNIEETFDSIQGEGLLSGFPAHFIRVWGCNAEAKGLECAEWCDTKYAWKKHMEGPEGFVMWTAKDLHEHVVDVTVPTIVFTGGEPLLYKETLKYWLANESTEFLKSHLICIETNGTIKRQDMPHKWLWFTVSPKPPNYLITPGPIHEIKIVVPKEALSDSGAWLFHFKEIALRPQVFKCPNHILQPQDNDLSVAKYISEVVLPGTSGWRLGLQLHKLLEVR